MTFTQQINAAISKFHLLKHPFYRDWVTGKLSKERIRHYAAQYYPHIEAFPRYISALHSITPDLKDRRVLLENLIDEEGIKSTPHPELWLQFSKGLGQHIPDVLNAKRGVAVQALITQFFAACRSSYAEGLSTLYTYEYQIPEIAETKIQGLIENYGISDKKTLDFFEVHKSADVVHRKACESLLNEVDEKDQKRALLSARNAAQALWDFLTEMHEVKLENAA